MGAQRSSASTRPRAAGTGTMCGGATVVICARMRACASATGIMAVIIGAIMRDSMNETLASSPEIELVYAAPAPPRPAGFWRRGVALLLDYVFLVLMMGVARGGAAPARGAA